MCQQEDAESPDDLKAVIAEFAYDKIIFFVKCDADGIVEQAVAAEKFKTAAGH